MHQFYMKKTSFFFIEVITMVIYHVLIPQNNPAYMCTQACHPGHCLQLTSNVVDVFLVFLHPSAVVLQRNHFITRCRGVIPQQLRQLLTVLGVFMYTKLQKCRTTDQRTIH